MTKRLALLVLFGCAIATFEQNSAFAQTSHWRVEDGGNGHWYELRTTDAGDWATARAICTSSGGDLVTVTSEAEKAFLAEQYGIPPWPWGQLCYVGLFQDRTAADFSEPEGGWRWVTGEVANWIPWIVDHPENSWDLQHWGVTYGAFDLDDWGPGTCCTPNRLCIEYSADCNNDGIVDKGQILAGQLPDANSNGVPDGCDCQPPLVSEQPSDVARATGGLAAFSVTSPSPSATTYLWHHNNIPLSNNAHISGADTATLSIINTQWADQGSYTCLVSGNCGSVMSDAATLTVTSCPPSWASFGTADLGARWVHAQAYSGVNSSTLVFGGRDAAGQSLGDTWLKSASGWSNVSTSGPAARTDHALAPLANGRVLLFGGKTAAAVNNSALGDTWEWDGSQWNQLSTTGPQARAGHAMCLDASRNRVVLFGGLDLNGLALGDTWEWNGSAWSQVSTTGPASRFAHTMGFDPVRGETLLFGGYVNGLRSDTWAWNGSSWREAATSGVSARFYAAAAFDAQLGRVLLFGGSTGGSVLGDAYIWTGAAWQAQAFGASPTPRWTHAMSYDAAAQRMVITGGAGSGATRFSDAWEQSGRAIVTSQPEAAMSRMAGDTVRLANTVAGTGPFTYRWKKGGANLFNSSIYSGVTTPTLTINTKDPSQSGLYTLAITSPCTVTTTLGTALEVYCGADWNNDGGIDGDDVILFFDQWDNGSIEADFTGDGSVDGDDVIGFFGRWDAGC